MDRAGRERGATAVAYAVMIAILATLLVGGVLVLSGSVEEALNEGANCVSNPSDCGDGGGTGNGDNGGGSPGGTTSTTNAGTTTTTTTTTGP